ncbi:hypothetical protein [Streptomyces sp. NBC_00151]|uniref:hypothetical protein n=1 Tax=Streptomyces sp. NBC_00151 TaxID=2975669 RepID=UPI002DDAA43E|nr:hypothetical protein [Streptomyces sp. NBC_00151]WRZ39677.1 hypothetical protein OG915_17485 [Streptomyces sp. NBC_00151]
MRLAARAAVAASALALVGVASTPASADGHHVYVAYSYGADDSSCESGGAIGFESYGDRVTVSDTCKDGHSAIGVVNIGDTFYYYWNKDGAGTTRAVDLELREGQPLAIQSCLGEWSGTPTGGILWNTCGPVTNDVTA